MGTDQISLFDYNSPDLEWEDIPASGASIRLRSNFINTKESDRLLGYFINNIPWRQDSIRMFNKEHKIPRLQQWYGDTGSVYVWSGIRMEPLPWIPELEHLRDEVQKVTGHEFNSVLLNYYRNGQDMVSWHSDDEPGLGRKPCIASISFGIGRDFIMRRIDDFDHKIKIHLTNGSLLVMDGDTQNFWQHTIPRRIKVKGPRVNLTFRNFCL